MVGLERCYCPNEACGHFGRMDLGNLTRQFAYGIRKDRYMLYCKTCKARFSETRCTAFFGSKFTSEDIGLILLASAEGRGVRATGRALALDKDAVNRVIHKASERCARALENLLLELDLTDIQLGHLWVFLEKRTLPEMRTKTRDPVESERR